MPRCARNSAEDKAQAILDRAISEAAIGAARSFADKTPGGTSLRSFQDLQHLWTQDDALTIDVLKATDTEFHYNVRRCRYAEAYREMGLGGDRPPSVVQSRCGLLRRLRPPHQAGAHADAHAGRQPIATSVTALKKRQSGGKRLAVRKETPYFSRMITSKLTSKAQTTIPQPGSARHSGCVRGDAIAYVIEAGHVVLTRARPNAVADDPFATFSEWDSAADTEAYAGL